MAATGQKQRFAFSGLTEMRLSLTTAYRPLNRRRSSAGPLIQGTFRIVVTGSEALVLNVRTVKLSEFSPTCSAVVMIPILTPPSVPAKLQSQPSQAAGVIDTPLLVRARHCLPPLAIGDTEQSPLGGIQASGINSILSFLAIKFFVMI
jgi:hypothetical protein